MPINLADKQKRYNDALANYRNACEYANKAHIAKRATLNTLISISDEISKEITADIDIATNSSSTAAADQTPNPTNDRLIGVVNASK